MMRRFSFVVLLVGLFLSAAGPASADTVGETRTFRVNTAYDAVSASSITATLRAVGDHAYLYVDDRHWEMLDPSRRGTYLQQVSDLAREFDTVIWPKSVQFWGSPAVPGVDGDPRIVILLQRLTSGTGGYFEDVHNFPTSQAPEGNAREMVFVAADSVPVGRADEFLAHEFQHLISFNQKELTLHTGDDVWLNEARSEYTITVAGYSQPYGGSSLQRRVQDFERTPSDSLVAWPNTIADYAIASVFGHYLAGRYGPEVLQHTIRSSVAGVAALSEWLAQKSLSERFPQVFADWMAASYANNRTADVRYGYATPGLESLRVAPSNATRVEMSGQTIWNLSLQEWQPAWVQADMPLTGLLSDQAMFRISGPSNAWLVGAIIGTYADGTRRIQTWGAGDGETVVGMSTQLGSQRLTSVVIAVGHGISAALDGRTVTTQPVTIAAALDGSIAPPLVLQDGDLIRHAGQPEVYVLWGKYRRYLPPGVLELYGFQSRPIHDVSTEVFGRYTTTNYVRVVGTEPVYAVWPDGTKHWLNITPAQWDASGRDWNAIFVINEREAAFYATGSDITR